MCTQLAAMSSVSREDDSAVSVELNSIGGGHLSPLLGHIVTVAGGSLSPNLEPDLPCSHISGTMK